MFCSTKLKSLILRPDCIIKYRQDPTYRKVRPQLNQESALCVHSKSASGLLWRIQGWPQTDLEWTWKGRTDIRCRPLFATENDKGNQQMYLKYTVWKKKTTGLLQTSVRKETPDPKVTHSRHREQTGVSFFVCFCVRLCLVGTVNLIRNRCKIKVELFVCTSWKQFFWCYCQQSVFFYLNLNQPLYVIACI